MWYNVISILDLSILYLPQRSQNVKIAIISYMKTVEIEPYIPSDCTEILTNIEHTEILATYKPDINEIINEADYVIVLTDGKSRIPAVCAKCKKLGKSFEIAFI